MSIRTKFGGVRGTAHQILLPIAALLIARTAHGQVNFFEPIPSPPGGFISSLAQDPLSGAVYAGVQYQWGYNNSGGCIFKSTDGGTHWSRIGGELSLIAEANTAVRGITCTANGVVYASFFNGGVHRSSDGGVHWIQTTAGLPSPRAREIRTSPSGEILLCIDAQGVYQLVPPATTWMSVNNGLASLDTRTLAVGPGYTLVGTRLGAFKRVGSGNWSAVNNGLGSIGINGFCILPGRLLACADNGLFESLDNAATWTPVAGPFTGSITIGAAQSGTALIVGSQAGTFRTTDGVNWQSVNAANGFTGTLGRAFLSIGSSLLMGSAEVGVFRSNDDGATWSDSNSGLNAQTILRVLATSHGDLIAGTPLAGLFRSPDAGASWAAPALPGRRIFALAESPWGDLYAGNYNIVGGVGDGHPYVSTDHGATWTVAGNPFASSMVSGFAFPGPVGEVLCSAAWNAGTVRQLSAAAASWSVVGPVSNDPGYFLGRAPNGDLYVGTEGRGVWRRDAGTNVWENKGFTTSQQFAVAFDAQGRVFFGNDGILRGVYRSTDNGQSFQPLNTYPSNYCHALAVSRDGSIYAASRDMGVWRSSDGGDSWTNVSSGLETTSVLSLSIGPDGYLYAGSAGHGVYRSSLRVNPCPADFNNDGGVDGDDVIAFFGAWDSGAMSADFNGDTGVDGDDVIAFFGAWDSGC